MMKQVVAPVTLGKDKLLAHITDMLSPQQGGAVVVQSSEWWCTAPV